jgi:hypothetical protein
MGSRPELRLIPGLTGKRLPDCRAEALVALAGHQAYCMAIGAKVHSDNRETWQCPVCFEVFHVIVGQDHEANHAPFCPGKPSAGYA